MSVLWCCGIRGGTHEEVVARIHVLVGLKEELPIRQVPPTTQCTMEWHALDNKCSVVPRSNCETCVGELSHTAIALARHDRQRQQNKRNYSAQRAASQHCAASCATFACAKIQGGARETSVCLLWCVCCVFEPPITIELPLRQKGVLDTRVCQALLKAHICAVLGAGSPPLPPNSSPSVANRGVERVSDFFLWFQDHALAGRSRRYVHVHHRLTSLCVCLWSQGRLQAHHRLRDGLADVRGQGAASVAIALLRSLRPARAKAHASASASDDSWPPRCATIAITTSARWPIARPIARCLRSKRRRR